MTQQELRNERDMLNGNLNRMIITDDLVELRSMYHFALERLTKIYESRCGVLRDRAKVSHRKGARNGTNRWR